MSPEQAHQVTHAIENFIEAKVAAMNLHPADEHRLKGTFTINALNDARHTLKAVLTDA